MTPEIGSYSHDDAMGMIRSAHSVTILSYEEAIAIYLRTRGILNDGNEMLGDPIPLDWRPKEQIRRLQETIDRKQAAKLALQKDVAELRQQVMQTREECAKVVEQTIDEMRLNDNQWARAGLLFAARAVRRGRHLTASEKLENFRKAMAELDDQHSGEPQPENELSRGDAPASTEGT